MGTWSPSGPSSVILGSSTRTAAGKDDSKNYLDFLVSLKNLVPGKSISIAAPSYWYLKQYPIKDIAKVADYIQPDPRGGRRP
ncbi:glycoside hydrolase [Apiospora rasikravindrae]|uniref:Glycoside hydrolase n=1 Tax=Apiospora rasikravindrae TaxID=990691 RepID=A0ABR1T076_9PEZI